MKKNGLVELMSLLLAAVFVTFIVIVSLSGVSVYEKVASRAEQSYLSFTPVMLIGEKLRRSGGADSVEIVSYEGSDALVINEGAVNGQNYYTYLFVSGGYLREAYSALGIEKLGGQSGQAICAAVELRAEFSEGLFSVSVTSENGSTQNICIYAP